MFVYFYFLHTTCTYIVRMNLNSKYRCKYQITYEIDDQVKDKVCIEYRSLSRLNRPKFSGFKVNYALP